MRIRKEPRRQLVRMVDFAPFPRIRGEQRERRGFTRDVSASGICLTVDVGEPVGSLLRLVVRGADGRPTLEALARVAWTHTEPGAPARLGLTLLSRRRAPSPCGRGAGARRSGHVRR